MAVYALVDTGSNIVRWTIVAEANLASDLLPTLTTVMIGSDSAGEVPCAPGWSWNGGTSFSPPPGEYEEE